MNLEKRKDGPRDTDFNYYLDITKYIKSLFGNILIKAEYQIDGYYSESEANEKAKNEIRYLQTITNSINIDAENIILYLKNGKRLEFSTSEWGWISFSEQKENEESGNTLATLSNQKLRQTLTILSDYCESGVEIKDNTILTMAYLQHPDDLNNAITLFKKDVEKEIIDRFMFLMED